MSAPRGLVRENVCSRGGSGPGVYLLRGGVPGGDPPGHLLLRAVRILLECILVVCSYCIFFFQDFFTALARVKQIHNDCKVLLRTNQQTAGYVLQFFVYEQNWNLGLLVYWHFCE